MTDVAVHRARPDEWRSYRTLRLAALADAPAAFGSTVADALALGEDDWRRRLIEGAGFIATIADRPAGLAAGFVEDGVAELVSMWVRGDARGRGAGDLLVEAVAGWAAGRGCSSVNLWVRAGNDPAERLYRRHGFTRTGRTQAVRESDPDRLEFQMTRSLEPGRR